MQIFNFFAHKDYYPYGTENRNILFMFSHFGFLFFNLLNVSYLVLFEGVIFGRLQKNYLSKLSFFAAFTQLISCLSSMHRYNNNDEFGFWGHFSTVVGLLAYTPFNIAFIYLCFNRNYPKFVGIGSAAWVVVEIYCFVHGYIKWEEEPFMYFRLFIGISTVWHVVAMIIGYRAHKRGEILIDESIISHEDMNKVFGLCIFLEVVALMIAPTGLPILAYPATGMTFTAMTILMVFVGRMNFMQASSPDEGAGSEKNDLLKSQSTASPVPRPPIDQPPHIATTV